MRSALNNKSGSLRKGDLVAVQLAVLPAMFYNRESVKDAMSTMQSWMVPRFCEDAFGVKRMSASVDAFTSAYPGSITESVCEVTETKHHLQNAFREYFRGLFEIVVEDLQNPKPVTPLDYAENLLRADPDTYSEVKCRLYKMIKYLSTTTAENCNALLSLYYSDVAALEKLYIGFENIELGLERFPDRIYCIDYPTPWYHWAAYSLAGVTLGAGFLASCIFAIRKSEHLRSNFVSKLRDKIGNKWRSWGGQGDNQAMVDEDDHEVDADPETASPSPFSI